MKLTIMLLAMSLAIIAAMNIHDEARKVEIDRLNNLNLTWKAGVVDRFRGQPIGSSRPLLGIKPESKLVLELGIALGEIQQVGPFEGARATTTLEGVLVPDEFDSATAWPQCAKVIGDIRDQSNCGCCWAFAAAESASDRICIASNGSTVLALSAQDMCVVE